MHIRYNETLLQYEYSDTGTDTGPWTKLDLTNHSGAVVIPPNIAFTNVANVFTEIQRIKRTKAYFVSEETVGALTPPAIGRFGAHHAQASIFSHNAFDDAGVWKIDNPADQGFFLQIYTGAGFSFYKAVGPNPAALTQLLQLDPSGVIRLYGGGIDFPVAQVSHSGPNTLDDYEEGAWTPALSFANGQVGIGYINQLGSYTKIGRNVTACCYLHVNSKGSSTGQMFIHGLPFYVANNTAMVNVQSAYMNNAVANVVSAGLIGLTNPNTPYIYMYHWTPAPTGTHTPLLNTQINSNCVFEITAHYITG